MWAVSYLKTKTDNESSSQVWLNQDSFTLQDTRLLQVPSICSTGHQTPPNPTHLLRQLDFSAGQAVPREAKTFPILGWFLFSSVSPTASLLLANC